MGAQSRLSADSPRGDPGRAGVHLGPSSGTWGRRASVLTDELPANRGLPTTLRIPPGEVRGGGGHERAWLDRWGRSRVRAWGGGWSQTHPAWEPLRCPNGPVRASLARPRPTIGSETRNGTDRAGQDPRTAWSQPKLWPWTTCPGLGCAPAQPLACLAGSLARACSPGLQKLAFSSDRSHIL